MGAYTKYIINIHYVYLLMKSRALQDLYRFCYPCYIPPEGYSEVDIVLNEDGGRNVAGKAVFHSEVVDLLKVLHEWHLEEESMHSVAFLPRLIFS